MRRVLALGAAAFLVLAALVIWIAQSAWLREKIRREAIAQAERATGGRVELGGFRFDWAALTAEFDRFVIHGTEPPGAAPLLSVERAIVGLRVVSLLRGDFAIASISAETPALHLIVSRAGLTNVPAPKVSGKPIDETILDLRISRFDVRSGSFALDREGDRPRIVPWNAKGENLSAHATWNALTRGYTGQFAVAPLNAVWQGRAVAAKLSASVAMARGRLSVPAAHLEGEGLVLDIFDGLYNGTLTARYRASYAGSGMKASSQGDLRAASASEYLVTGILNASLSGNRDAGKASAHFEASPTLIDVRDAHVAGFGGDATGAVQIRNLETFRALGNLRHIHLASLPIPNFRLPYDGYLSGSFEAAGNLRNPRALTSASLRGDIAGPAASGRVDVHYNGSAIEFGHSWFELPHTRVDLAGTLGSRLDVKLQSRDVADLAPLFAAAPSGLHVEQIAFEGTVTGPLKEPRIAGRLSAGNIEYRGFALDSIAGAVTAAKDSAAIANGTVVVGGIPVRGSGSIALAEWQPSPGSTIAANVETNGASFARVLELTGEKEIELSGSLNASAQLTGTLGEPRGGGDISLIRGAVYGQPFDSIAGRVEIAGAGSQTFTGLFISGPKRVNIVSRLALAGADFPAGRLEFNLTSNTMPLNQIALVRRQQPDIHGFGKFHADGTLRIARGPHRDLVFDLLSLNADASANSLELTGRNLGDARLMASTKDGTLTARFDSNAAKAAIHGDASMALNGDYPVSGKVTFTEAGLNALATLIAKPEDARNINFDGTAEGDLSFSGALKKPDSIAAQFNVSRLQVHALNLPDFEVVNKGPVRGSVTARAIGIESANLTAPQTDMTVLGAVTLNSPQPAGCPCMDLRLRGSVNLALARTFIPDLASSGSVTVDAAMKGTWNTPDFSGRATIRNADFHYADFTNGLTNASGELVFTGSRATIQSFHGESGGGTIDASGFAAVSAGLVAFRLETNAHSVRVRYPEGVSSVSDARIVLAGTSERSLASGTVTIHRVAINPRSDAATILASTTQPVRTPALRTGLIENVNFDIQIQTAPDVVLETSITQTIQADANLRLRGTVSNPAMLGRINITQGDLVFFGNRYSINQGAISFYNPSKIDPILNIDLETKARGVDVILTVSGPVGKLNVSYRSDPPLQFSDIVALLATGRTPGDPTGAVRDLGQSQSFQQLGASELLGQAIANPVAGRLQRFFGVSRLKIDPQLTGITGSPQARLTIEQQVTPDILFTYITDVSSTSTQLIRVEWAYNRHWSAILTREENGYVGLDFAYKKRFR